MSSTQPINPKRPWYYSIWKVLALFLLTILILIGLLIGWRVLYYYKQIKISGLPKDIQTQITPDPSLSKNNTNKADLAYSTKDDPSFGNPNAPLQVVEFADFECSFSREESFIIRDLQARYPDLIHLSFRDFPLRASHPRSFRAAEAGNCANEQDKFWLMHDKLFQNSTRLEDLDIKLYALEIGLDIAKFNTCFDEHKYKDEIEIDLADGAAAGVEGTPTFFMNGQRVPGALPLSAWEQIISKAKN